MSSTTPSRHSDHRYVSPQNLIGYSGRGKNTGPQIISTASSINTEETLNVVDEELIDLLDIPPRLLLRSILKGFKLSIILLFGIVTAIVTAKLLVVHSLYEDPALGNQFHVLHILCCMYSVALSTIALIVCCVISPNWNPIDVFHGVSLRRIMVCALCKALGSAFQFISGPSLSYNCRIWISTYTGVAVTTCGMSLIASAVPVSWRYLFIKRTSIHAFAPTILLTVGVVLVSLNAYVNSPTRRGEIEIFHPFIQLGSSFFHGVAFLILEYHFVSRDVYTMYVIILLSTCETYFSSLVTIWLYFIPNYGYLDINSLSKVFDMATIQSSSVVIAFIVVSWLELYAWVKISQWGNSLLLWICILTSHTVATITFGAQHPPDVLEIVAVVAIVVGLTLLIVTTKFYTHVLELHHTPLRKAICSIRIGHSILHHKTTNQSVFAKGLHTLGLVATAFEPTIAAAPISVTLMNPHFSSTITDDSSEHYR